MRALALLAAVVFGLLAGSLVLRVGWELPERMTCTGDTCRSQSWLSVDWARVNWELRPRRIACFEANPGPNAVIIGPEDECVRSRGDVIERRATYEQLRSEIFQRRVAALILAAAAVLVPPLAVAVRRPRRAAPTPAG
jgi:hypothetical protein